MITIEEKRTADYADKTGRIHMRCAEEDEGAGLAVCNFFFGAAHVDTTVFIRIIRGSLFFDSNYAKFPSMADDRW